jgi:hypothetical protein
VRLSLLAVLLCLRCVGGGASVLLLAGCRLCFPFREIQQRKTKSIFAKIEKENEVIKNNP